MQKSITKTKLLIIGSGPAGLSAAIYAARSMLEPILIQGIQAGGQLTITTEVENYPGFTSIQGPELIKQMEEQAKSVGTKFVSDAVERVDFSKKPFKIYMISGDEYESDSVVIATGANAQWLGLDSEKKFQGYGVSGCATCDGFFFKDKKVLVIGGGNTAVEEALYLTNHAKEVFLIHRRDKLRAEKILQDRLFKNNKISIVWNTILEEILGDLSPKTVTGAIIKNTKSGDSKKIDCDGIFIAIGHKPNTSIFKDQINMDREGYIITEADSTKTNIAGVYAAGDVQDKIYRQAVTAAGTGCMAALEANHFLSNGNL